MDWLFILLILVVILFISLLVYHILTLHLIQQHYKRSLSNRLQRNSSQWNGNVFVKGFQPFIHHLDIMLTSIRLPIKVNQFISLTVLLILLGFILGSLYFTQLSSVMLCSFMFGSLPYIGVRTYLVHRRIEAQREFLPAVELFYQCYLINGGKQIKLALSKTVEEKGLMAAMQQNFTQLHRNLTLYPDYEYSLSIFSHATGHRWSNYFVQLILVALNEGVSIKGGLKELIDDMRKARKQNEVERHRVLEIRIANFTPMLFLVFFMTINLSVNYSQSIEAYLFDEAGRKMILHACVLIALSFMMGIHLSRKKMG